MNLKKIETEVAVDKIAHKGISIWPILKSYLIGIVGENNIIKEANLPYLKLFLKTLPSDFLSIKNMGKSKYWVFSSSQTRFYINEDSFDRVSTGLLKYLEGYVLFENPIPKGKTESKKLQKGEYYVGMSWVYLIQFIILKLSKNPKIENLNLLETYLKKDISKIKYIYHRIQAGKKLYNVLFKFYKPKAIFVVCYYSNFELILAAKKNNIPVIELQHGLVTDSHRAYHYKEKQPSNLLPDYFLSYGKYASDIVIEGNLFEKTQVLDYGYTFIEEVQERLSISHELQEIKKSFKKTVCITGQLEITDAPLLKIILNISHKFPDICFIFKPRHYVQDESFNSSPNFVRLGSINTYELLKYCDYHLTVYSTCALEALALGTPTISLDIKGYYSRFLMRLLGKNPYNFVAKTEEELVVVLNEIEGRTFVKSEIKQSISHVFSPQVDSVEFNDFFKKIES
ncbi:hypothetical protein [uncultured Zobellia sp.]|uniref:hypothetical protein n=1 Tax=uncultured Zobellia sp. TaxID=255433 RepID=UPI002594866F|nr:hypothetical protein [uncultured Zobellia sp.]